jgi:DNA polymerase elongation subunit (family B)
MTKTVQIFDIETLKNCFTATFLCTKTQEVNQFVIHEGRDDLYELITFMEKNCLGMVGFNSISFDYPVLHQLILFYKNCKEYTPTEVIDMIYQKAQDIITSQNSDNFNEKYKHIVPEWEFLIPQLDLFKIYHFDNPAKRTSLKDVEIALNWKRVQDMPIHHSSEVTLEDIPMILEYNLNDVEATYEFYKKSKDRITLRKELTDTYGINLMNANDPKIGAEIFGKFISEQNKISLKELKRMRTFRPIIHFKECILPYITFNSQPFKDCLEKFKTISIKETKDSFSHSVIYKGFKYDFGTGGIHGCIESGVYESTEMEEILSCDVTSLYPSIAIVNKFYPEHLGLNFCNIYKTVYETRAKAKREGQKAVNEGLKLALNGVYGKSNDKNSFFFDPKFTMQITLNGQMLLCMLAEKFQDEGFKMLMINTDGIEVLVPKDRKARYFEICKRWEAYTKLNLEFAEYGKMVIRDVNNYSAITTEGKIKHKGAFEQEKEINKDPSNKIVRIALSEYFFKGIPFEQTIKNHKNIYDFIGRFKSTKGWHVELKSVGYDELDSPFIKVETLQKTNRYYISTNGGTLHKRHEDPKKKAGKQVVEKDVYVTIFNNYVEKEMKDYNIYYDYYILECEKIRRVIESNQMALFS